ncbi:MAG: ABC transporter permease, partial [Phycisphaerales bacterium]
AMAVAIGLGPGITSAVIGVVLASIPWYFRLLRSEVLRIRTLMYVDSARALGASSFRLIRRHILPQTTSTILIQASSVFSFSILTLAALGFVGLGVQPPVPEWGTMITEGLAFALTGQWWLGFFPGLGIFLLAVSANLIADRLRDIYDPKSAVGAG